MSKKSPQLRFEGFTDDWEERKLSSMTDYKNGKGHEDKQSTFGKFELINLNSISISGGLKHSGKFIDEADDTLQKDDLVMILSDVGHGDLLGRVALIPEDDRFVLNQRVALLRPNATADPQFLFSYINAHQYYFKAQGAGMSQLNISKGSVENFISFVPIIEEQKKIGSFFKELDDAIALHQRKLDLLKEQKKGFLQKMFPKNGAKVPELRFAGFADDWELRKLTDITSSYSGLTYSPTDIQDTGTFVLRSSNVKNDQLIDADNVYVNPDIVNSINVKVGDVIIVVRNGSRTLIGKHAIVNEEMPNTVIGAFMSAFRGENGNYVNALLSTENFQKEVHKSLGATINQITGKDFSMMIFPTPKFEEQQKIGTFFKQLDDTIALHQRKLDLLKEQKKGFLQKMFV